MPELTQNIGLLSPEFALAGLALAILAIDLFLPDDKKKLTPWLSAAGLAGIIALSLSMLWGRQETLYGGLLAVDACSLFFKVFFLGLGILIIFSSMEFVDRRLENPGEFYGLLLLSILGMNVMVQARELLTAWIALELLSFCLYVMASYAKGEPKSNEAGLKYILIGAFSSAILLYGVSMIYSTLGVTRFADIALALSLAGAGEISPALWAGLALLVVGLGFKVSVVPFHMWAPDVYEGAPLPVTAYLAIGSKAAAFALILRLVAEGFVPAEALWSQWQIIFAVMAAVTMLVGNLVALAQTNIKRLMAYSSIGHAGFLLAGIAALAPSSVLASNGVMLYLVGYSISNLLVFAAIISFFNLTSREEIADLGGLADRQPFLAACIAVGFFSLGGLPIFAGFVIKFYLFVALASAGFLWLAGLAIFSSLISIYYYLKVIRQMYIEPVPAYVAAELETEAGLTQEAGTDTDTADDPGQELSPSILMLGVLAISLVAVVSLGVYPAPLLDLVEAASHAILPGA